MKALSIKQPWAWAIINCKKNIENRSWKTNFRGKFLIHAPLKIDKNGYNKLIKMGIKLPEIKKLKTGGIIGQAEIIDCVDNHRSKWFTGKYGFILKNSKKLKFFNEKGQLNFFESKYK